MTAGAVLGRLGDNPAGLSPQRATRPSGDAGAHNGGRGSGGVKRHQHRPVWDAGTPSAALGGLRTRRPGPVTALQGRPASGTPGPALGVGGRTQPRVFPLRRGGAFEKRRRRWKPNTDRNPPGSQGHPLRRVPVGVSHSTGPGGRGFSDVGVWAEQAVGRGGLRLHRGRIRFAPPWKSL